MSGLEKNLSKFKEKLSERNVLTEDDISELESHILDKVDDLKQNGFNEDDAFDKAVSDLGPIDEIAAEYSKVNLSPSTKFLLLCFGYFSVNFMISIIYSITLIFTKFIEHTKPSYDYKDIPLFTSLTRLLLSDNNSNYYTLVIFLFNTALMLLLLYFILRKKNNLLSIIADKALIIQRSNIAIKLAVSIFIAASPLIIYMLLPVMIYNSASYMIFAIELNNLNCSLIDIVLILTLIIRYMRSKTPESTSSYMILGYLIITVAIRCIPSLTLIISILMNKYNVFCISILFITFFVITCCLMKLLSKKMILEDRPSIIPAAILLVVFIGSYFIHPLTSSLDYTLFRDCLDKFSNLSSAAQFCLNLLAAAAIISGYKLPFSRKRSIE